MGKKGISHRKFSIEFKLSVLSDYFRSNVSINRSTYLKGYSCAVILPL